MRSHHSILLIPFSRSLSTSPPNVQAGIPALCQQLPSRDEAANARPAVPACPRAPRRATALLAQVLRCAGVLLVPRSPAQDTHRGAAGSLPAASVPAGLPAPDHGQTARFLVLQPHSDRLSHRHSLGASRSPGAAWSQPWQRSQSDQSPTIGFARCRTSIPLPPLCLADSSFTRNKGPVALGRAWEELTKGDSFSATLRLLSQAESLPLPAATRDGTAGPDLFGGFGTGGCGRRLGSCGITPSDMHTRFGKAGKGTEDSEQLQTVQRPCFLDGLGRAPELLGGPVQVNQTQAIALGKVWGFLRFSGGGHSFLMWQGHFWHGARVAQSRRLGQKGSDYIC